MGYMDEEDQNVGYIIRVATPTETKLLPEKFQDEEMIFKTCENLAVHTYRLPMTVVDVEYQFDRHKITIFYDSPVRIDFRELVRDLFSSFKARIWMKKVNQFQQPDIKHYAAMALATGVQ